MTPSAIENRIFVVGVPRSGTTLVQSLLAAHSRVTSFTESHFFSRHFRLLPLTSAAILITDPVPRLREFLAENGVAAPGEIAALAARLPARPPLPFRTRAVARRLLAILDDLAERRGASSWVEKTPRHLRYAPFLERLSGPDRRTLFVHVIRDGLEVVASLHAASRSWERPYDLETCVRRWNADVGFSLHRVRSSADRVVFYEDLTSRPEATLERLVTGLGLAWEPEILGRYSARGLVTREETWKSGVEGGVRRAATSERVLTAEQRGRVSASLRHALYARLRERTS